MFSPMNVTVISKDLINKSIGVDFSLDIDENSINDNTIQVTEYDTRKLIECDYVVEDKHLDIFLKDNIVPNTIYLIRINDVHSILGDRLPSTIRKKVVFKSDVTSKINIISPSDFEKIKITRIEFEELNDLNNYTSQYQIQIATSNSFNNVITNTIVKNKTQVILDDLNDGQYYLRIRAVSDNQYGQWSDTVTFCKYTESKNDDSTNNDDDIIFEDQLEPIQIPAHNTTPKIFKFLFDADLDEDISLNNIIITKRRL